MRHYNFASVQGLLLAAGIGPLPIRDCDWLYMRCISLYFVVAIDMSGEGYVNCVLG